MLHQLPIQDLGPRGSAMGDAISRCVHCGFCLPTCPTYRVLGEEMDSPRGRILLMKEVLEGGLKVEDAQVHMDRCLGCVACMTACPSGVNYGELVTSYRAHAEPIRRRSLLDRLTRAMILQTLPYPGRFRAGLWAGRLARPLAGWLPQRMRAMLSLIPKRIPPAERLPTLVPARGTRRARVALLSGCAQQVLAPQINRDTISVLAAQGVEVVIPPGQRCCGALAAHTGALPQAVQLAKHNVRVFPQDVDAIVTNAAGCGSGVHEYPLWLRNEPEESLAREFAHKVMDASLFLDRLGTVGRWRLPEPTVVAYHDACHLAHAQKVKQPPRRLLAAVENVELREIEAGEICCGSAGTYNIEQPEIAAQLGAEKARYILATGAQRVAMGNIGCMTQIEASLARIAGAAAPRVQHTFSLLAEAIVPG